MSIPSPGDDGDRPCRFLVLLDTGNLVRPVFVMAKTFQHARLKAMQKVGYLENAPVLNMTVHVLGESEIAPIVPELKELAWRYFCEGAGQYATKSLDDESMQAELREQFEAVWDT